LQTGLGVLSWCIIRLDSGVAHRLSVWARICYGAKVKSKRLWAITLLLPWLAGCSSFNREWRAAAKQSQSPNNISGRWEGTWQNTNNSHRDKLRAILTRVSEGEYQAHFHAKYKKVLTFTYQATFRGAWTNSQFVFHGEENLGKLAGGTYKYEGRISPTNFFSTYDSRYDKGTFTLARLEPSANQ
jgi:hypothetical protein